MVVTQVDSLQKGVLNFAFQIVEVLADESESKSLVAYGGHVTGGSTSFEMLSIVK